MEAFENKAVPNREIILKTNSKTQKKTVVHSDVTKYLKNHQVDGIKFMFENCFEQNSGCILAHCMGLGKTLQVIALLHAVINSKEYKTNKILVLCPISTIMNWKEEILRWLGSINDGHRKLQILELGQKDNIDRKITFLQNWSQCDSESPAICLIMGYDSFRNLVNFHTTKANAKKYKESSLRQIRDRIRKYLLAPADIVICDEGHVIKNSTAGITLAVNQIETKRRIVLTGTPMQNHLMEYYSMVNFVRPSFLGSRQHFAEYFADPIKSGQHADSCVTDIKHMKQRSYALHKKLSKIVQRREISLLKDFLPEKFEFVLFIPLTHIQYDLYKYFLANRGGVIEAKRLFGDYTCLRKKRRTTNVDDGSNDDDADEEYGPSGALQMVDNDWWRKAIDKKQLENASSSHKMIILFEILNECKRVGDKCVIFSSFVEVLNVVEYFMQQIDQHNGEAGLENFVGPWRKNEDYYRLDGSTPKDRRPSMINNFNDENNKRTKVLLISTEAGGQGINLFGANRLILLDTSWNPSKDQQSIFRIYRMGQNKQCYIYRLLSMGTMEEKIYSRSVTKQAMSCRVVDKQQIDRHFSMSELDELYSLTKTDMAKRVAPIPPRDDLLAHLLRKYPNMIYKYLEHDSLLANKVEEELNDIEKSEAWRRCQEQNLQMQALNNLMANGEPTATPFKLHKEMLPALELKNRSVVNMGKIRKVEVFLLKVTIGRDVSGKKAVYSQHNKENVSFGNEMAGHISANTIDMEHELADDKLSSLSDDAQMDVQPSLWRSNSYKWLPPSNEIATGIEPNDDLRGPLLPLETFENGSNDSHDDIQENVYNIDGEVERRSRSAAADKKVFKLNGNLNGNEPEQAIQQTDTEPSVERSNSCVWLAASHAASLDDTKRALTLNNVDNRSNDSSNHDIQRRPLEKGNHNNLDGGVERSLTDIVKGLLHTLNNKYAASSQQPYSLEDYTIEEQILLPNEFDNLEYRIALKRPSSGGIHRPIKRLKLSLEIDPVAALPLTTECPMDVIMENPQSQHADGNVGFPNLNGENEDVCSNSAQQSEFVTDPAPTEYVENNFNADIDTNEVIVMTNGSEGKVSVRSEGTLLDDEDEDIFHADVDPDEVIVTANGSEGKESDSVRVEVAFPDDDSTSDDEEKCSDSVQQSKELVTDLAPTESYEDIFNADVDSDEVIAKTSGSEGKQPIFVRVERTFPVDIEDDDEMSPIESTEPINLNDLSHNDEPAGDDFMSSDEYMEEAVAPTHSYDQINCIQSENEQDSGSSDGDDLHDVQFYEEQPSTMSKIVERCALM
ncbi:hypothetical protein HA402_000195 [Bradysia odoriphaga]|nr:hypothetical protein HA402_000195 [Bradysia odoriphaga]